MNKAERQARHQQRLEQKRQREEEMAKYSGFWRRFETEARKSIHQLPDRSSEHPYMVSLLYEPSDANPIHVRLEWNDNSILWTQKSWLFDIDYKFSEDAPQGPSDPRPPAGYWEELKPSIEEYHETLPRNMASELIEQIGKLRISVQPPIPRDVPEHVRQTAEFFNKPIQEFAAHSWCLDGSSYELSFAQGGAISKWKWYNNAPEEWKDLENIASFLLNIISR